MTDQNVKRAIVFDYDDTLTMDTERKKQGLFVDCFSDLGVDLSAVRSFVLAHYGTPRAEMIKGCLSLLAECGCVENTDAKFEHYLRRFSSMAEDMAVEAELRPGAFEALRKLKPFYILSGNPQEAIENIVNRRGWDPLVRAVFGTTTGSKIEHLATIMQREGASPLQTVVIGDGQSDLKAAKVHGCRFIGIRGPLSSFVSDPDFPILDDLWTLPEVVENALAARG